MTFPRDTTNVYSVATEAQWPEVLDPFVIYNVLYDFPPFGAGLYCTDGTTLVPLADKTWLAARQGLQALWAWNDTQTAADPGSGYMKANQAQIRDATELYVSNFTLQGEDIGPAVNDAFKQGHQLQLLNADRAGITLYDMTADPINNGTWSTYPVAYDLGGKQNPQLDDIIEFRWFPTFDGGQSRRMDPEGFYDGGVPLP